jgi:hypothetical protein
LRIGIKKYKKIIKEKITKSINNWKFIYIILLVDNLIIIHE